MKEQRNTWRRRGVIYAAWSHLFSLAGISALIVLVAPGCSDQDQGVQATSNNGAGHDSDSKGAGDSGANDTGPSLTISVQRDDSTGDGSQSTAKSTSQAHKSARRRHHRTKKSEDAKKTNEPSGVGSDASSTGTDSRSLPTGDARPPTSGRQTTSGDSPNNGTAGGGTGDGTGNGGDGPSPPGNRN